MYDRKPYLEARVSFFDDESEENKDTCQELAHRGTKLLGQFTAISAVQNGYGFTETMNFKSISFVIAGCEGFSKEEKQQFLEMTSTYKRLKKSVDSLEKIIERTKITSENPQNNRRQWGYGQTSLLHKPPASIRFTPLIHALAVTVEPFQFSPAEPVTYEWS